MMIVKIEKSILGNRRGRKKEERKRGGKGGEDGGDISQLLYPCKLCISQY